MKIKLEIEVPEYEWVDAPMEIWTPLGVFDNEQHVQAVGDLLYYLKSLRDIQKIIQSDENDIRTPLCCEWVRNRLPFVPQNEIRDVGEKLSYWLDRFTYRSGHEICEYVFESSVKSTGKKIKFKNFSMLFNSEMDAFKQIARNHVNSFDFKPEVQ